MYFGTFDVFNIFKEFQTFHCAIAESEKTCTNKGKSGYPEVI